VVLSLEIFYHELEVATKITAMAFCILFAGYFWNKRRHAELKSTRMVLLGQGLFVFCLGLTRVLFIISDYFSTDPEDINVVLEANEFLFSLFWKLSALVGILAIIFLLVVIETYLVRSRYIFSIIASIGLALALIFQDINLARWVTYITMPLALFGVLILYIYLARKGSGDIRTRAIMSVFGLLVLAAGVMLDTTSSKITLAEIFGFFPGFIPIIILISGIGIYTYYNIKA
jgi:hypothetical protein